MNKSQYDAVHQNYDVHLLKVKAKNKTGDEDVIKQLNLEDKNLDVLELGCGGGINAEQLLKQYQNIKSYFGIDNSEGMLQDAKLRVKDSRASFAFADFDNYDFGENKYDLVFGVYAVHYTDDLEKLMKNVYRSLRSGGYLYIKDTHPLVGFFKKQSKDYRIKEKVHFPIAGGGSVTVTHPTFTVDEYINSAIEAGFEISGINEEMGSQSEALGVSGFKIPTKLIVSLFKG